MIGRLNHVAIVVSDLKLASKSYKEILGATVSKSATLIDHGVKLVFIDLPNTKIELLEPIGKDSVISSFLKKHPLGGLHHICYEVLDINLAKQKLIKNGARILGSEDPKIGAHGKPVLFLHPKDFNGTLIELEQI